MKKEGHRFEDLVAIELLRLGCRMNRGGALDHRSKTDFEVLSANGAPLKCPVRVQLTLRLSDLHKLSCFLQSNTDFNGSLLYVEAADCSPLHVAIRLNQVLESGGRQRCCMVRIHFEGMMVHVLTVEERHKLMTGTCERRFLTGGITGKRGKCLNIRGSDGYSYEALPIDLVNHDLRSQLTPLRPDQTLSAPIHVRFVPAYANGHRLAKSIERI